MSKQINAIIKNKITIELVEDAKAGDYIDLANLTNVDLSNIEKQITDAKDAVYQKKLSEAIAKEIKIKESELALKYQEDLRRQEVSLTQTKQKLEVEIAELKAKLSSASADAKLAYQDELIKNNEKHQAELDQERAKYAELNEQYLLLRNQKASINNKMIGENLEHYCDAAVREALQAGMLNCTWDKDNKPEKDPDEEKGTKADYLFRVYLTEEHVPEELLTSVCLEMKDENPDSKSTKTNEDHYKKLDGDRKKKNCKYALLVSNLDFKNENIPPIYRVLEYPDMYVIRPAYLVTFLSIIVSLTTRFQDLILSSINNEMNLKAQSEFLDEFDKLKNTYLDKPLNTLQKKIEGILAQTENVRTAVNSIDALCIDITNQYLEQIESKLAKFDAGMRSNYRKLNR